MPHPRLIITLGAVAVAAALSAAPATAVDPDARNPGARHRGVEADLDAHTIVITCPPTVQAKYTVSETLPPPGWTDRGHGESAPKTLQLVGGTLVPGGLLSCQYGNEGFGTGSMARPYPAKVVECSVAHGFNPRTVTFTCLGP